MEPGSGGAAAGSALNGSKREASQNVESDDGDDADESAVLDALRAEVRTMHSAHTSIPQLHEVLLYMSAAVLPTCAFMHRPHAQARGVASCPPM